MSEPKKTEEKQERARLIRYGYLPDGLLSKLDREKNILHIDIERRKALTPMSQNMLDCSDADQTRLVDTPSGPYYEAC